MARSRLLVASVNSKGQQVTSDLIDCSEHLGARMGTCVFHDNVSHKCEQTALETPRILVCLAVRDKAAKKSIRNMSSRQPHASNESRVILWGASLHGAYFRLTVVRTESGKKLETISNGSHKLH
eukprot:1696579-Amphidinium_carterae.1